MTRLSSLLAICLLLIALATGVRSQYRRVCYYTNWAQYRPKPGKFIPSDVPVQLCTHLIYAFATMEGNKLKAFEWNDEDQPWAKGMFATFNDLKQTQPGLKTLLAVGGWNFGVAKMTKMLSTAHTRAEFVHTSIEFLRQRNFDGLDLDFEYPGDRGSPAEDKGRFSELLAELFQGFESEAQTSGKPRLLLTAAVAAGQAKVDAGYDVPSLGRYLDFVNIMTYDFHGKWEDKTGHNSPLFAHALERGTGATLNLAYAATYWRKNGVPADKLNIGLPLYGRTFTLTKSAETGVGAAVKGGGKSGKFTQEEGYLSFYEVCDFINRGAQVFWIEDQKVPYAVLGDQWLAFDDDNSLKQKVKWAKENGFGGVMVWALDLDDFSGRCGGDKFPLLRAINEELSSTSVASTDVVVQPAASEATVANNVNPAPVVAPIITPVDTLSSDTDLASLALNVVPSDVSFNMPNLLKQFNDLGLFIQPEPVPAEFCRGRVDGSYAVDQDCNRYVDCFDGQTRTLRCPGGTYFQTTDKVCMVDTENKCLSSFSLFGRSGDGDNASQEKYLGFPSPYRMTQVGSESYPHASKFGHPAYSHLPSIPLYDAQMSMLPYFSYNSHRSPRAVPPQSALLESPPFFVPQFIQPVEPRYIDILDSQPGSQSNIYDSRERNEQRGSTSQDVPPRSGSTALATVYDHRYGLVTDQRSRDRDVTEQSADVTRRSGDVGSGWSSSRERKDSADVGAGTANQRRRRGGSGDAGDKGDYRPDVPVYDDDIVFHMSRDADGRLRLP